MRSKPEAGPQQSNNDVEPDQDDRDAFEQTRPRAASPEETGPPRRRPARSTAFRSQPSATVARSVRKKPERLRNWSMCSQVPPRDPESNVWDSEPTIQRTIRRRGRRFYRKYLKINVLSVLYRPDRTDHLSHRPDIMDTERSAPLATAQATVAAVPRDGRIRLVPP